MNRQRFMALSAIALLLMAAVDFTQRIYVPREHKARGEGSMTPAAVRLPPPAASIRKDLATWIPALRPVAGVAEGAVDTEWTLTLMAVFDDRNNSFAVIRATPGGGGAAKVQRVAQGESMYGYKVARIEREKIVLTGENGEHTLQLFKRESAAVAASGPAPGGPDSTARVPSAPAPQPAAPSVASTAPVAAPPSQESRAGPNAVPAPAAPASGGAAQNKGWRPGEPVELPPSMRGLKIVDAPLPPEPAKSSNPSPRTSPPPQPPKNP